MYVGLSAWGLAVHKEARMIAVSTNEHKVHIFAYALSTSATNANDPKYKSARAMLEMDWSPCSQGDFLVPRNSDRNRGQNPLLRSKNLWFALCHHETNIPTLSFF